MHDEDRATYHKRASSINFSSHISLYGYIVKSCTALKVNEHAANKLYTSTGKEKDTAKVIERKTFFNSMMSFHLISDTSGVHRAVVCVMNAYLDAVPLRFMRHRRYTSLHEFVGDLLGFFDAYMAWHVMNPARSFAF